MANPDDLVGRQVGRYAVVRHLASGGMAELYIARQESVGGFEKQVVLKILQPRYAKNPRVVTMFLDEARLAAKLNHPAIVHVYDVADEGGLKYIAMEYIHGETIADIVKRGLAVDRYLPLEYAIHIVRQAAIGLAYAHARKEADGKVVRIVHRDISPTNILVSYEGQTGDRRLRHRPRAGRAARGGGDLPGQGVVHVARAGARRDGGPPVGHLLSGDHPLRADALSAAVPGTSRRGDEADRERAGSAADGHPARLSGRAGAHRHAGAGEAPRRIATRRRRRCTTISEEFLNESGLRSGNRRVAIYMNELFAPDCRGRGRGGGRRGSGGARLRSPRPAEHAHRAGG